MCKAVSPGPGASVSIQTSASASREFSRVIGRLVRPQIALVRSVSQYWSMQFSNRAHSVGQCVHGYSPSGAFAVCCSSGAVREHVPSRRRFRDVWRDVLQLFLYHCGSPALMPCLCVGVREAALALFADVFLHGGLCGVEHCVLTVIMAPKVTDVDRLVITHWAFPSRQLTGSLCPHRSAQPESRRRRYGGRSSRSPRVDGSLLVWLYNWPRKSALDERVPRRSILCQSEPVELRYVSQFQHRL